MKTTLVNRITKKLLLVAVAFALTSHAPTIALAQGQNVESEQPLTGPRKQLATIIFSGLAGAVLGLSTLSFYGRPQDHLKNIAIGFAAGVMGGTAYVTYRATMHPEEFYAGSFEDSITRSAYENYQLAQHKTIGPIYVQWEF